MQCAWRSCVGASFLAKGGRAISDTCKGREGSSGVGSFAPSSSLCRPRPSPPPTAPQTRVVAPKPHLGTLKRDLGHPSFLFFSREKAKPRFSCGDRTVSSVVPLWLATGEERAPGAEAEKPDACFKLPRPRPPPCEVGRRGPRCNIWRAPDIFRIYRQTRDLAGRGLASYDAGARPVAPRRPQGA